MKKLSFLFAALVAGMSFVGTGAVLTPTNCSKVIEISVSGYAGTETLQDFPVLVKLSESIVDFDYGDFKLAKGGDLRVALEDGTLLPSEIDTWDETGTSLVWVKVPALEKDAKIFVYYGNETPEEVSAADVWNDGYAAVYHLGESALPMKESGARATDFTASEGNGIVFAADGAIGKGVNFVATGTTRGLKALDHDKLDGFAAMTVEIWTYQAAHATVAIVDKRAGYDNDTAWQMYDGNGPTTFGICSTPTGKGAVNVNIINPPLNAWNYQVYTYDSTLSSARTKGYLNGAYVNSNNSQSGAVRASAAPLWLGIFQSGDNRNFPGKVDELRISNVARSADWIKAGYDTVNAEGFLTYGPAKDMDETAVVFDGVPTVEKSGESFTMSVRLSEESGTAKLSAVYGSDDPLENVVLFETSATAGNTYQYSFEDLADDASYSFAVVGESVKGSLAQRTGTESFYTGNLSIAKVRDADEKDLLTPGAIAVCRADTNGILNVHYTVGGTAVPGTHYEPLSGLVTIPAGATSATIDIHPIRAKDKDTTVEITLTDGLYFLDDAAKTASIAILKLVAPDGWNTWVAGADGKASDADNWSDGVPKAGDKVLFDERYSTASCEWDGGVNGLTDTVAAWSQSAGYTGKVTVDTLFPEVANATFTCLTVTGDMTIDGGALIHPAHTDESKAKKENYWRLRLNVGGKLTVGTDGVISAYGKGSYGTVSHGGSAYGGSYDGANAWGSLTEPYEVGSSPNADGACNTPAGGAIWIEVVGATTINGTISANGVLGWGKWNDYAGSGGAIYLKTASLDGSGKISADCSNDSKRGSNSQTGAGGRVSILLTSDELTDFPSDNITAYGGIASYAHFGGAGTVLVRSPQKPNGILYFRDRSTNKYNMYGYRPKATSLTMIPSGQTWTLDGIVFGPNAILRVPTGTTLNLVNGLGSVSSTGTERENGLLIDGGSLILPSGDQTISGPWIFQTTNGVINGNLTVTDNGSVGTHFLVVESKALLRRCDLTVTGDMTVNKCAYVYARRGGYSKTDAALPGGTTPSVHGGQNGYTTGIAAYGSIVSPSEGGAFGNDIGRANYGGGAVKLTVGGTLTLNGEMLATPICSDRRPGAGGSIDITAAHLIGDGLISANGAMRDYFEGGTTDRGASGGGRISVKLTDPTAVISDEWRARVNATGATPKASKMTASDASSAGTVFLRDSTGESLVIRNDNNAANNVAFTSIPSLTSGGESDELKHTRLSIEGRSIVKLAADLRMSQLVMLANTKLDLNGNTLTVDTAKLGGAKLKVGTYAAVDYPDFLIGEGSLVVKGTGLMLLVR